MSESLWAVPGAEYWLLLHFEPAKGAPDRDACLARLRKRMPKYDKGNLDTAALERAHPCRPRGKIDILFALQ